MVFGERSLIMGKGDATKREGGKLRFTPTKGEGGGFSMLKMGTHNVF